MDVDKDTNDQTNMTNMDNSQTEVVVVGQYNPVTEWHNNNIITYPIQFGDFPNTTQHSTAQQATQNISISQLLEYSPTHTTPHLANQGLYSGPNYRAQQALAQQVHATQAPQPPTDQPPMPQSQQAPLPKPSLPQPQTPPLPNPPEPQTPSLPHPPEPQTPSMPHPPEPQTPPLPNPPKPQTPPLQHPPQPPLPQAFNGPMYAYHGPQHHPAQEHQNNYRGHRGHMGYRGHRGHPYRGGNRGTGHRNILNFDKVHQAIKESDDFGRTDRLTAEAAKKIDYNTYGKWLDRRTRMDRSTMKIVENQPEKRPEERYITDPRQLNKLDSKVTETVFNDYNNQSDPVGFNFMNSYYSALKVPFSKEISNKQNCVCGKQSIGTLRQTVGHLGTHSHIHLGRVRCILCLTNGGEPKVFDTPDALFRHITNAHERSLFTSHVQANFPTPNGADLFLLGYGQLLISYTLGELAREGYLSNKFWESG